MGKPVGNALDHGVGYTFGAYRDHFHSHCGLEAVLPNGDVVRTGMGALPGAKTWAEYRYGFGPTVDGLFAQGNLGIVTKMGFHLLPAPEAYQTSVVTVPRRRDIVPLIDLVNELENQALIGMPEYSSPLGGFGPPPTELAALLKKPGGATDEDFDQVRAGSAIVAPGAVGCSSTVRRKSSRHISNTPGTGSTRWCRDRRFRTAS